MRCKQKKKFCARRLAQSTGNLREELKIGAFFRFGNMASRDQNFTSSEDESTGEVRIHEELPRGSERDVVEHYFYKGLPYRQIVLMLEKHHNLIMNQRTLKRRLKDFGLTRRKTVDKELRESVKDIILQENVPVLIA